MIFGVCFVLYLIKLSVGKGSLEWVNANLHTKYIRRHINPDTSTYIFTFSAWHVRARFHSGKYSSDKKISFVLNLLVVPGTDGNSQDKGKLFVQGKFSWVETGLYSIQCDQIKLKQDPQTENQTEKPEKVCCACLATIFVVTHCTCAV